MRDGSWLGPDKSHPQESLSAAQEQEELRNFLQKLPDSVVFLGLGRSSEPGARRGEGVAKPVRFKNFWRCHEAIT
jgi:hypothetical protein